MEKKQSLSQQIFEAAGATIGWLSVIGQFYLIILNRNDSVGETIIRFFSYFTVLTNIVVALCFTACWLNKDNLSPTFFTRSSTLAATTVYILVVGIVYNIILRPMEQHTGLQWLVNELLHLVIPILFTLYWILFAPKEGLTVRGILPWLIYPLFYTLFIIFRGAFSGFYPYPFINVDKLGYPRAFINAAGLTGVFLLASLILVGLGRQMKKRKSPL